MLARPRPQVICPACRTAWYPELVFSEDRQTDQEHSCGFGFGPLLTVMELFGFRKPVAQREAREGLGDPGDPARGESGRKKEGPERIFHFLNE